MTSNNRTEDSKVAALQSRKPWLIAGAVLVLAVIGVAVARRKG